jgi:cation transport ATPase
LDALLQRAWSGNIVVIIAVLTGGYPIFKESLVALGKGRVNMELSMIIAIIVSLALSQYFQAILIRSLHFCQNVEGFIVKKRKGKYTATL